MKLSFNIKILFNKNLIPVKDGSDIFSRCLQEKAKGAEMRLRTCYVSCVVATLL
jgi:hypothetical protein